MCGIVGIYGSRGNKNQREGSIRQMISTLQHRGPDGWGYYLSPEIVLGQTRLSIVDLEGGNQPMVDGDYIIILNGEIYNFIELREELRQLGMKFTTTSDTEVLLKAFVKFGVDCFSKLNGQFAVLIWNKKTKELTIARDRFAIRPLYYTFFEGQFLFSSEMKAFDSLPGFVRNYNPKRLFEHGLLWNTYGDNTVYNDIKSLPGGTYAIFKDGVIISEEKFYELGESNTYDFKTLDEAQEEFKRLMNDAVKLRLRSDVPVGAYLSGGIDSSVILSLISKHTSNIYKTFSVTFDDKEFDESSYQNEMAQRINTEHHASDISYQVIDDLFPEAIYHTERPVFRTAPIPLYKLSSEVRKNNIKVVLTGEGADEILWGYDSFKEIQLLEFWNKYPDSKIRPLLIRKLYPHLQHYKDEQQYGMMVMFYEEFLGEVNNELASVNIRVRNNKILQNYLNKDFDIKFNKDLLINELKANLPSNYSEWNLLQKNQYMEMHTLLSGYLLSSQGDRMSMANSVEGRYPFLDHRVVDMLFYIKDRFKLNGFNQKYLLKKAYGQDIPSSIINRPKRPYTSPDLKSFMQNGKLSENSQYFLNDSLIKEYGTFNPKWVTRFLNKFTEGLPENLGYRDNMIITFILSTQIANYWAKHPKKHMLPEHLLTVKIDDYK